LKAGKIRKQSTKLKAAWMDRWIILGYCPNPAV
jgi:hypothetical protein